VKDFDESTAVALELRQIRAVLNHLNGAISNELSLTTQTILISTFCVAVIGEDRLQTR